MMEQSQDPEESLRGKLHDLLDESDSEECGQFCFQEEAVEEVMQELYKEMIAFPLSQTLPSPVFINEGKNGSFGASVSDTASTVMAGIEIDSPAVGFPVTGNASTVVVVGEEKKIEEFDGGDLDDEWIGRVLSWSQQINQVEVVEDNRQWF